MNKPYPFLISGAGAIDITGVPGAPALLSRAVWGLLDAPQIAVRPLDVAGKPTARTPWRISDAIQSWAWAGYEGTPADVEVYSCDDQVELRLNGRSLGRQTVSPATRYVARFRVPYEPGELVAVGLRGGQESGRSSLRSAAAPTLRLRVETPAPVDDQDRLAFVWVELADADGTIESTASDVVTLTVTGPAVLAGFGNSQPTTEESYTDAKHSTYRGQAFAVIRSIPDPEGSDLVVVQATSRTHGDANLPLIIS